MMLALEEHGIVNDAGKEVTIVLTTSHVRCQNVKFVRASARSCASKPEVEHRAAQL